MTEYAHTSLDFGRDVATLTLRRPPANLLDITTIEEYTDRLLSLRDREGLKVLVIRGAGGTFSEGFDYADHTPERVQRLIAVFMRVFEVLRMMPVITVAAIEGRAWGAGFELALGCNLFAAAETATFALPQIKAGLIPPVASAILPRIVPRRRAMEWILTGNLISARRLEHDGVVNRLLPEDHFDAQLDAFIAELTGKSGPVLQLARRAQFEAYYGTFPDALSSIQSMYLRELMELEDARQGPATVLEGRKPDWRNR
ncbi:MAG: enoyl-CoA hydratase/isomerase family protein [Gemmatimonadetes bacterium]|nr:enoyl-CoA hydratase/isomerase family protein [Gemmatimonadota bacterium]